MTGNDEKAVRELSPCPFCGGYKWGRVVCYYCGATTQAVRDADGVAAPAAVPVGKLRELLADWSAEVEMSDENSADPFMRGAATARRKCLDELEQLAREHEDGQG